jgi:MFS family permease
MQSPRMLSSLFVREFRRYLVGYAFVATGLWMQRVALTWLVLDLTGSSFAVGVAVGLQFAPVLLVGLHGGWAADRLRKRPLLCGTGAAMCLLAASVGLLTVVGEVRVGQVYLMSALLGLVTAVDNPGRQLLVSQAVSHDRLRNAVSLSSTVYQVGGLVGPALSGVLIARFGVGWCLVVTAACFLPSLVTTPATDPLREATSSQRSTPQVLRGLRHARDTPALRWPLVLVCFVAACSSQLTVVLSAFAEDVFASGAAGFGVLCSALSLGSMMGALASARLGRSRLRRLVPTAGVYGAVLLVASFAPSGPVLGAMLITAGAACLAFLTAANATVQLASGPGMRGRMMGIYLLASVGGAPVAGLLVGAVADHLGPRAALAVCGVLPLSAAFVVAHRVARRAGLRLRLDHLAGRRLPRPQLRPSPARG